MEQKPSPKNKIRNNMLYKIRNDGSERFCEDPNCLASRATEKLQLEIFGMLVMQRLQ